MFSQGLLVLTALAASVLGQDGTCSVLPPDFGPLTSLLQLSRQVVLILP